MKTRNIRSSEAGVFLKLQSLKVLGNIRSEAVNFFLAKLGKKSFIENGSYT